MKAFWTLPKRAARRVRMRRRLSFGVLLLHAPARSFRLPARATSFGSALSAAEEAFLGGDVPEARLSAEHLLASAAGLRDRSRLLPLGAERLPESAREAFEGMCARRLRRAPVQYIVGDWDFHELTLRVAPPVFAQSGGRRTLSAPPAIRRQRWGRPCSTVIVSSRRC